MPIVIVIASELLHMQTNTHTHTHKDVMDEANLRNHACISLWSVHTSFKNQMASQRGYLDTQRHTLSNQLTSTIVTTKAVQYM